MITMHDILTESLAQDYSIGGAVESIAEYLGWARNRRELDCDAAPIGHAVYSLRSITRGIGYRAPKR
jgi:hypothetical protein